MGHKHLIRLPATKKWNEVVELLVEGAELETIAAAAAEAAESSLPKASGDPALVRAFWLLTQIPLAARTQDFGGSLRKLGVETRPSPGLVEVVGRLCLSAPAAHLPGAGIVGAILDGRQPRGLRLAELLGDGPLAWNAQRETWGFSN